MFGGRGDKDNTLKYCTSHGAPSNLLLTQGMEHNLDLLQVASPQCTQSTLKTKASCQKVLSLIFIYINLLFVMECSAASRASKASLLSCVAFRSAAMLNRRNCHCPTMCNPTTKRHSKWLDRRTNVCIFIDLYQL